ncbi:MAG: hypothetical protein GXP27_03515, partial [Planctomycetes bacterium]|nr:hypothetical protein [Planctomycetota bacterium]
MPASDHYFYDLKKLHVAFAVASAALLIATVWMIADDHAADWRDHQATMDLIESQRLRDELAAAKRRLAGSEQAYDARVAELKQRLQTARDEITRGRGRVSELASRVRQLESTVELLEARVRAARSIRDVCRADWDLAVRDGRPDPQTRALLERFRRQQQEVERLENELEEKKASLAKTQRELQAATEAMGRLEKQLRKLTGEVDRLERSLIQIQPESGLATFKRKLLQSPLFDAFNSPRKIVNDWLPDLPIRLGMAETARFDRCRTCHLGIDRVGPGGKPMFPLGRPGTSDPKTWVARGEYPHPYATHPRLDLYVAEHSPHPRSRFGCTVCHEGQGSAATFPNTQHTPNDPLTARRWAEQHGWRPNRFWEYPMLPKRLREAACLKCHHSVIELGESSRYRRTAPKVYEGWQLVRTYGCFGCHPISGFQDGRPIGPDLRLKPNYQAVALQLLALIASADGSDGEGSPDGGMKTATTELQALLRQIVDRPDESAEARRRVRELVREQQADSAENPSTHSAKQSSMARWWSSPQFRPLVDALRDQRAAGTMAKVGPSLRRIAQKATAEWMAYWLQEPRRFRKRTRMPHFFGLINQRDVTGGRFASVEIAAIVEYLLSKSQPAELLDFRDAAKRAGAPQFQPDVQRGQRALRQRGCLACHRHKEIPELTPDYAPGLFKVHLKLKPGEDGFRWLYTWLRDPRRHDLGTRMPHMFLEPEGTGETYQDPAADIAAYLLKDGPGDYPPVSLDDAALDQLVLLYLSKAIGRKRAEELLRSGDASVASTAAVPDDEIELLSGPITRKAKLNYVGRKTITRYGCFGCHDIPGFETARPIGVALHDWGRKDVTMLAFNHIERYLEAHGEPDGTSTRRRVERAIAQAASGSFATEEQEETELRAAFFYNSLIRHQRAGFLWQKLREPRSYDYLAIQTKKYDERLRMPQFAFTEQQIEAIATFVLGLVSDPPPEPYVYRPDRREA